MTTGHLRVPLSLDNRVMTFRHGLRPIFLRRARQVLIPAVIACTPWLAHDQARPCPPVGASAAAAGHRACAPAPEGEVDTGSRDGLFHFSAVLPTLDPTCRESTFQTMSACPEKGDGPQKRCWRTKLTPACQAQMASTNLQRDPACTQQAGACEGAAMADFQGCIQRGLPARCMEQIRTANRERERKNSACSRDDPRVAAAIQACHGTGGIAWEVETCIVKARREACH